MMKSMTIASVGWMCFAVAVGGCGDDDEVGLAMQGGDANVPSASPMKGMDAAQDGSSDPTNVDRDSGGQSGSLSRDATVTPSSPIGTPATCQSAGPTPEPGDDACLACAIQKCCESEGGACITHQFDRIGDGGLKGCYGQNVVSVRACFEERAMEEPLTESWYLVAECVDEYRGSNPDVTSAPWPTGEDLVGDLVECIAGSRPPSADDDAGIGEDGRVLPQENAYGFNPAEHCAEECFPGWH